MKILAIDTATEACSVALNNGTEQFQEFEICPQQHSQRLLPMVDSVLKQAKMSLSDLDLLAFGRGPGSFTGVRIATGMIQGLALGTGLKVVGVSTLAAMAVEAASISQNTLIACATDARMGEVYFAVYQVKEGSCQQVIEEQVCPPDVAARLLTDYVNQHAYTFVPAGTGWQAYEVLGALLPSDNEITVLYPNAAFMMDLASSLYASGEVKVAAEVAPVYLRDKVTWKKLPGRE